MILHRLIFDLYRVLRHVARSLGVLKPTRRIIGPVVGRFLYRITPKDSRTTQLHGHTLILAPPGRYPPLDMSMGRYEPSTTERFQSIVKPRMSVIDIGAHIGYYTLLAAKLVGESGKVYAFEPEPDNYSILTSNILANNYENIIATQSAVSDQIGSTHIYLTALDSGRHSIYRHGLPELGVAQVNTTTLDSFLGLEGWPHIDVMKMDVEGAEIAVFNGMSELMERCPNLQLLVEFNPSLLKNSGSKPQEFLLRLLEDSWDIEIIDEVYKGSRLIEGDVDTLTNKLLVVGSSVNLFCKRP